MTGAALIDPAVFHLLRLQSRGRVRRMWRRFLLPRRMVLSAVAFVLAAVWLGNALATIWLRESASRETLHAMLSFGFALYAGWHFTKAAMFRPTAPFDWSPAERELLAACPLHPRDLVAYQLASVAIPTLLKAVLFALLLLPDLDSLPLGLCGMLLGLYLLEVLRIAVAVFAWGISSQTYLVYRATVVGGLLGVGIWVTSWLLNARPAARRLEIGAGILDRSVELLVQLGASPIRYATLPFRPFIEIITAERLTAGATGWALTAVGIVAAVCVATVWSYGTLDRRRKFREKLSYAAADSERSLANPAVRKTCRFVPQRTVDQPHALAQPLRWLRRCGGAGPLAWRQLLGARRHWGSLLTALIAPAVLAVTPCFVIEDSLNAYLATAGAVAFYTFLLLPTALRFDFRRDLDRLAMLKGLPVRPAAVAIGQTATPVFITTAFQGIVLAFAIIARGQPPHFLPATLCVLLPMNLFVFGLDNLIFLLYPYRIQQEGLEIFLRTMLTFTGKGLLFVVGICVMSAWGFAAAALARQVALWAGREVNAYAVFTTGMVVGMALLAAAVLAGVCRTYRRLDPVEDIPR